jgi:hypothetical protein
MKKVDIKKLLEKYKNGASNLEEDAFLRANKTDLDVKEEMYFTFLEKKKATVPKNLNDILWENFEKKRNKIKRLRIGVFSAVASLALIISLFFINPTEEEMSYEEKLALLKEAKAMIANAEQESNYKNIIYEDELIIIYTIKEQF